MPQLEPLIPTLPSAVTRAKQLSAFFASLECELLDRHRFRNQHEVHLEPSDCEFNGEPQVEPQTAGLLWNLVEFNGIKAKRPNHCGVSVCLVSSRFLQLRRIGRLSTPRQAR